MSDASYIELPPQPKKRSSFFRSWRGVVLLLFVAAVILAGCFSWWLAQGKITSVYARVDTIVYTVQPEIAARLNDVLVRNGQEVQQGQALARINPDIAGQSAPPPQAAPDSGYASRLVATSETEKRISAQLARARAEEERFQQIHHERVTEHVRAQLMLRSVDQRDAFAYGQASQGEATARRNMDLAREEFEKASKARAAMEVELGRIRTELVRKKLRSGKNVAVDDKPVEKPVAPVALETLYAPISGRIVDISASQGQLLYRGQPVFMILPSARSGKDDTWIQAWFPLSARHMLKLGQKAQIKSGELHLAGMVSAIGSEGQSMPSAAPAYRQEHGEYLPVRIQVENEREIAKLTPGAKVECQIQTRYVIGEAMF